MKRRPHGKPPHHQSAPGGAPAGLCRALVLADGSAIRNKIKKDYEKAVRDLDSARRQFDQFHQTDAPQFIRWLNGHFGALLTELRELSQKLEADEALIFQVESAAMFGGGSHTQAYKRVMAARNNPGPPPPPPGHPGESEEEEEPPGAHQGPGDSAGRKNPLNALFEELFGDFDGDEGAGQERFFHGGPPPEPPAPPPASARLKELYRALVRRLHPDTQKEMTAQKTEWWHQAQAAYEAGDVEQLEVILTLCEIGESGTTAHTSASLLQRITARVKSSLREIKRQVADLRRDPAWGFSGEADHGAREARMRRGLTDDLRVLQDRWRETQAIIARWKTAAERPPGKRRRKAPVSYPEFPF